MREEIEAAVTFLTRLLAKSVDPGGIASGANSTNGSIAATNLTLPTYKDSTISKINNENLHPPHQNNNHSQPQHNHQPLTEEKIKKFSQKLMEILTQRFQNHWYPHNPSKGQGYRCIRINQNCRVDVSIELACQHAGISYESLRLPVELTLWIDPSEVTCRFGEHKGSFCIVAKLAGDGRQENYVDSINIDELEQRSIDRSKQSFENPRMKMKPSHLASRQMLSQKQIRSQTQANSMNMNPFTSSAAGSNMLNNNVSSFHAMNGGAVTMPNGNSLTSNNHMTSHGSPVGGTLTNGFGVAEFSPMNASNGLTAVFGPIGTGGQGGAGGSTAGTSLTFGQPSVGGATGGSASSQGPFGSYGATAASFYPGISPFQAASNYHQASAVAAAAAAAMISHHPYGGSPGNGGSSHLFGNASSKYMSGMTAAGTASPQHPTSSTPPSSVGSGLQPNSGRASSVLTGGSAGFRAGQVNPAMITSASTVTSSSATSTPILTSRSLNHSQQLTSVLTNGLASNNNGQMNASSTSNGNGSNPNAASFVPRNNSFNLSAQPFTPIANNFPSQTLEPTSNNGTSTVVGTSSANVVRERRSFVGSANQSATPSAISPAAAAATSGATAVIATPLVANRF